MCVSKKEKLTIILSRDMHEFKFMPETKCHVRFEIVLVRILKSGHKLEDACEDERNVNYGNFILCGSACSHQLTVFKV